MSFKVLLDANVLISASIYFVSKDLSLDIKHRDYVKSKTLINHFKKNVDRKEGIYTELINETSKAQLNKAVIDTIDEIKRSGKKANEITIMRSFSTILSECHRRLQENMSCLVRETINEKEIDKVMGKILSFFRYELRGKIMNINPQKKIDELLKRGKFKGKMGSVIKSTRIDNIKRDNPHYNVLKRKFIDSPPDTNDMEILAQAIYFNKVYEKYKTNCILCSLDHHFVAIEKNDSVQDIVPKQLEKQFKILCLSPNETLQKIKDNV